MVYLTLHQDQRKQNKQRITFSGFEHRCEQQSQTRSNYCRNQQRMDETDEALTRYGEEDMLSQRDEQIIDMCGSSFIPAI
jgi:hypothetical protein